MNEWNKAAQRMINWIEAHIDKAPTLTAMARELGYSPYYCSSQFHKIVGKSLKSYTAQRRLSRAAADIRDTNGRILDIAMRYGYSSQQALTRAFAQRYGCTPAAYRRAPRAASFTMKKEVLFPQTTNQKEAKIMEKKALTQPTVRIEYIPAHKFIGIWEDGASNYWEFWEKHECDDVTGIVESLGHLALPPFPLHMGGFYPLAGGKNGYFYGLAVPADYDGHVPEDFELRAYPGSYYMVFSHPPFDFMQDCETVVPCVDKLAWEYDPSAQGYAWDEPHGQMYQRMLPETLGYEVLRPIKKAGA